MKSLFYPGLIWLLLGAAPLFAQSSNTSSPGKLLIKGQEILRDQPELKKSFSSFDLVQIDLAPLIERAQKEDLFEVQLDLGEKHLWNLVLLYHDLRAPNYQEIITTTLDPKIMPRRRANTFKGYMNTPGSPGEAVRLNISEYRINGYVKVHGKVYFIEPMNLTVPGSRADYYVIYRPEDVISKKENRCSFNQVQEREAYETGEVDVQKKMISTACREVEVVTACTYDYVAFQGSPLAANDQITAITNLVEGLYSPFNLTYTIIGQLAPASLSADPFTSTVSATTLLEEMATLGSGGTFPPHDAGQLWTKRDINDCGDNQSDSVIGCAKCEYCICTADKYNVVESYTEATNCLQVLSAHEYGHLFGGQHVEFGFTIMSDPIVCTATTFNDFNEFNITEYIGTITCLEMYDCCELVIDCNWLRDNTYTCIEDFPEPDINLVQVKEYCDTYDITVEEEGSGTISDPLIRTYTVTDLRGNVETCVQTLKARGGSARTANILQNGNCILADLDITGAYSECQNISIEAIELTFSRDGIAQASVFVTMNNDGTWTFSSTLATMVGLGLNYGTWYDLIPLMHLSNGEVNPGGELKYGLNNDVYFGAQSDPQVIVNDDPNDPNTTGTRFCEGSPLFYHGLDPLSADHFSAIRKRPVGLPFPFGHYEDVDWLGVSLDHYTGDLNAQYPGYFEAGYEYQLYIASGDTGEGCITWSPVTVEFEIVDCCQPDWGFTNLPDCVQEGKVFSSTLTLEGPYTAADINKIEAIGDDYTYIGYSLTENESTTDLTVLFLNNTCTCGGSPLVFDVEMAECNNSLRFSTPALPCCAEECSDLQILSAEAEEECVLINGQEAHHFCITVLSSSSINDIHPGLPSGACPIALSNLSIQQQTISGVYQICGYFIFEDPACTTQAEVNLMAETYDGCCEIVQNFAFDQACMIEEVCFQVDPTVQLIYPTGSISISMNIPLGETVSLVNLQTGSSQDISITSILCGPFGVDQNGNVFGGVPCNGISFQSVQKINCADGSGEMSIPYAFEIRWGDCVWVLSGDYCDEMITGGFEDGLQGEDPSRPSQSDKGYTGQFKVFPNPIANTGTLYFNWQKFEGEVQAIDLKDIQGRQLATIFPKTNQKGLQYQLDKTLDQGLYFVVFHLSNGEVHTTRLITLQ